MMSSTSRTSSPVDARGQVLDDPHQARRFGRRAAVGRDLHQVDPDRDRDRAHQVGHERQRALEHAHERQLAARVLRADLPPQLGDLGLAICSSDRRTSPTSAWRSTGRVTRRCLHGGRAAGAGAGIAAAASGALDAPRRPAGPAAADEQRGAGAEERRRAAMIARSRGHDLARAFRTALDQRELAVLEHQRPEVARVEQLDPHVGVELAQATELPVLLPDEPLPQRRQLEVQVQVRQVEVGREALDDGALEVPQDREHVGSYSQRTA